jgi:hypothetical protein
MPNLAAKAVLDQPCSRYSLSSTRFSLPYIAASITKAASVIEKRPSRPYRAIRPPHGRRGACNFSPRCVCKILPPLTRHSRFATFIDPLSCCCALPWLTLTSVDSQGFNFGSRIEEICECVDGYSVSPSDLPFDWTREDVQAAVRVSGELSSELRWLLNEAA